jgi:hypothetical protein
MPEIGLLISMFLHPQGPACTQDLGSLPSQLTRLWCALHASVEACNVCTQLMALCFLPCRLLRIQELHTRNWSLRLSATVCCQGIRQRKEPCTGKRQDSSSQLAGSKTGQDGSTQTCHRTYGAQQPPEYCLAV